MANGVTTSSPTARSVPREILPPTFTAVEEKRFESEIRRIDTTLAGERKNREKFEIEVLKRFDKVDVRFEKVDSNIRDLRSEMNARFESVYLRFEKVDAKFDKLADKMDSYFRWMMGLLVGATLIPIALQFFAK
ncbi:MAG: hypothetical protein LBS00_11555 [Synergistaceae bacterium]|nr:hypothetical protein [Synergistaceae bacterium]